MGTFSFLTLARGPEFFYFISCYPASRGFSLAWLLAFTKSFAWLVYHVVDLFTPSEKRFSRFSWGEKTNQGWQVTYANDFVNAKIDAREKTLLAR